MKRLAAYGVSFFFAARLCGQMLAPIPLADVVKQEPERKQFAIDPKHKGDLLTWRVSDPLSPYSGTTLVWLQVEDGDVRVSVDGTPSFDDITRSGGTDSSIVAIANGGMWRGRFDSPWKERTADGLVVASGKPVGDFKPATNGGVAVMCGDDVSILRVSDFPKQNQPKKVVLPCNKKSPSALQSNLILVNDGVADAIAGSTAANRLAFGTGHDTVVIAGAFSSSGHALTLRQFSEFLVAAAKRQRVKSFDAVNLDGECGAQLWVPKLKLHFGCEGTSYTVNRIVMRSAR
jgi:hypothetical protein